MLVELPKRPQDDTSRRRDGRPPRRMPFPDLTPLLPGWDRLCRYYRETLFDRQLDLFGDPWNDELQRWHRFVLRRCIEVVLDRPDWTRLILESVGFLPVLPVDLDWLCEDDPVTGPDCFDIIMIANRENKCFL